jgi:hypothetical protein
VVGPAEGAQLVEGAALPEVVEPEAVVEVREAAVVAGQAPAVVIAEVEEEALPRSGPGASQETRGLPETPRPASAWHRREHSPSAGRHPCLSSV